jgi:hypothetical protein
MRKPNTILLKFSLSGFLLLLNFFSYLNVDAQHFDLAHYAQYISPSEAKKSLELLKGTNQGNNIRNYLDSLNNAIDVKTQSVNLIRIVPIEVFLKTRKKSFTFLKDFVCLTNKTIDESTMPVTYLEVTSIIQKDKLPYITGKAVLLNLDKMNDLPKSDFNTRFQVKMLIDYLKMEAKAIFFFTKDASLIKLYGDLYTNDNDITEKNISDEDKMALQVMVSEEVASAIMGVPIGRLLRLKAFAEGEVTYKNVSRINTTSHQNIYCIIRGTNPEEKSIVILARYDSVKYDYTFKDTYTGEEQGADANWSGTVSSMQMAKAFSSVITNGAKPERNIIFMFYTGGFEGTVGLNHYLTNPVVPLRNSIIINLDMIGRCERNVRNDTTYVYLMSARPLNSQGREILQNIMNDAKMLKIVTSLNNGYFDLPVGYNNRYPYFDLQLRDAGLIFHIDGLAPDNNDVVPNLREDAIDLKLLSSRATDAFRIAWTLAFSKVKIGFD